MVKHVKYTHCRILGRNAADVGGADPSNGISHIVCELKECKFRETARPNSLIEKKSRLGSIRSPPASQLREDGKNVRFP